MKKLIYSTLVFLIIIGCKAQQPPGLSHMTPDLWIKDIDHLNARMQKEFASFDPTVKDLFARNMESLKQELAGLSNEQTAIRLSQFVSRLGDGHTEVQLFQSDTDLRRFPLSYYFFEEGLYILGAHESYRKHIGNQVVSIGGKDVPQVFELLKTLMTHDNKYEILHFGPAFLMLPEVFIFLGLSNSNNTANIEIKTANGSTEKIQIKAVSLTEYSDGPWYRFFDHKNIDRPLSSKVMKRNHWFEYLEQEKTMYFYYGTVNDQKGHPGIRKVVKQLFAEIDRLKPDKIVIDIRRNSGGNYHKSRPLIEAIKDRPWLNKEGKIYAISGRRTFSAAMVTSIFLKRETQTILVGEPSRGHPNKTDNVEHLKLPNSNLRIEYTTRVKHHWPELGDAKWVPIDVMIIPTFATYSKGIDPVMEYILKN